MFQIYWDCDSWCAVALIYLLTYAFVWLPGLLSLMTGVLCGFFMPRNERRVSFKVGLFTGVVIVVLLIVWTAWVVTYESENTGGSYLWIYSVYLAFHILSILAPIVTCYYIHSRRNEWWGLNPPSVP